ncbi:MAG: AraC-like DNA-binding protein [Bacteroidia bacterium]|jgi:AraC-like DNA-binding protein
MDLISLNLWNQPFVDCLTSESDLRVNQVMQDDACFSYVQSGTQEVYSSTGKIVAKGGESILMKCSNFIADNSNPEPNTTFGSVVFHLNFNTVKKAFEGKDISFLKSESISVKPSLKISHSQEMDAFISSLTPYFENPDSAREEIMVLKLQELVYLLCDSGGNQVATQIIGSLQSQAQITFEDIIAANLYSGLSLSELAHITARSVSSLKRDFTKWYNESPAKYFKAKRLEKAAKLLKNTNLRVNEIAWDCGFENTAHFSASFRKLFGQTPKEYRD